MRPDSFPRLYCSAFLSPYAAAPADTSSNNTRESETHLLSTLEDMGLRASAHELMTSLGACRALVEKRGLS